MMTRSLHVEICSVPRLTLAVWQPFPLPYKQSHYEDACRPKLRNTNGSRKWSHSKKEQVENTFSSTEPRLREEQKHALREISNNLNLNLQGYYLNFWNSESHLNNLIILISHLRVPQFIFFKVRISLDCKPLWPLELPVNGWLFMQISLTRKSPLNAEGSYKVPLLPDLLALRK